MSNVLEFALGIETAEWVHGLTESSAKVIEFLGVVEGSERVLDKFFNTIKEGGALFQKSFSLPISTGSLYQLGEAFKSVGVEEGEVEGFSLRLQRALTGINDAGGRTEIFFGALGLHMRSLRTLNPAQQIMAVTDAMSKLNQTQQTGIAEGLFGRGQAGPLLQIARQAEQFRDAFARSAQDAASFQKLGGVFNNLNIRSIEIRSHISAMFAEAAAGFAGPLQHALDTIEHFPWHKWGSEAASVINGIFGAWKSGQLGLLVGDSLRLGFQVGSTFFDLLIQRGMVEWDAFTDFITISFIKAFQKVFEFMRMGLMAEMEKLKGSLGKIPGLGEALGLAGYQSKTHKQLKLLDQIDRRQDDKNIGALNDAMNGDISGRRAASNEAFGKAWDALINGPLKEFAGRWKDLIKPPKLNGPQSQDHPGSPDALLGPRINNATQYEKLGFVLSTVASMSGDHARQTAQSTASIDKKMDRFISVAESLGAGRSGAHHHAP